MNLYNIGKYILISLVLLSVSGVVTAGHRARLLNKAAVDHILEVWPTLRSGLIASVPGVENDYARGWQHHSGCRLSTHIDSQC